jgi:hypothetical protein
MSCPKKYDNYRAKLDSALLNVEGREFIVVAPNPRTTLPPHLTSSVPPHTQPLLDDCSPNRRSRRRPQASARAWSATWSTARARPTGKVEIDDGLGLAQTTRDNYWFEWRLGAIEERLSKMHTKELVDVCSGHLQQFPNTFPYPYKTVILGQLYFFLAPAVSQYLSIFLWPPIFSSSPLKERERYNSPNTRGPFQLPLFSHIFSYTPVRPTFYICIGRDILGVLLQQLPSKSRKWYWATPIPSY